MRREPSRVGTMNNTAIQETAAAMKKRAIQIRCGGRTEKYQRDGEHGSFPADDVLALCEHILAEQPKP